MAIVITSTIILLGLGSWQLARLRHKKAFIQQIEYNITHSAINQEDFKNHKLELYSKIKIRGRFLSGQDVLLYGRRSAAPEKDGYYLLSPFKSDNGQTYLVSRGWLPQSQKKTIHNLPEASSLEITAITMPGEQSQFMMPKNDIERKIWFVIDLEMATKAMGIDPNNFYLMQIDAQDLPSSVKPLSATHLSKVRNDHLEYAITWYALAVCLAIGYIVYLNQNGQQGSEARISD